MTPHLKNLKDLQWYSHKEEERVLSLLPVHFGFYGKGKENFACVHPKQVHGVSVVEASVINTTTQADGVYTQKAGQVIGVRTADCLPVLFASEKATTVMAVHAGWRGLSSGILGKAVEIMQKQSPKEAIFASIGPSIAHCHYEVGPEVLEALQGLNFDQEQFALCLSVGTKDRWFLDLPTAATWALLNAGISVKKLSVFRSCTYCHSDQWHSYRRDSQATSPSSLRNWSWISKN